MPNDGNSDEVSIPLNHYDEWMLFLKVTTLRKTTKKRVRDAIKKLDNALAAKIRFVSSYQLYGHWDALVRFAVARSSEQPSDDAARRIAHCVKKALEMPCLSSRDDSTRSILLQIDKIDYQGPNWSGGHFMWDGWMYLRRKMRRSFIILRKADGSDIDDSDWIAAIESVEKGIDDIQLGDEKSAEMHLDAHRSRNSLRSFWTLHRSRESIVIEGLFHVADFEDLDRITMQLADSEKDAPTWIRETHIGYQHKEWAIERFKNSIDAAKTIVEAHDFLTEGERTFPNDPQLEPEQLSRWLCHAAWHCRQFSQILRMAIKAMQTSNVRLNSMILQILRRNLRDEEGRDKRGLPDATQAHYRKYIDIAEQLKISKQQLETFEIAQNLRSAIAEIIAYKNPGQMFGYILVNEALISIIFQRITKAFAEHHPSLDISFFELHVEADDKHVRQLLIAGDQFPESFDSDIEDGIRRGMNATLCLLEEAYGPRLGSRNDIGSDSNRSDADDFNEPRRTSPMQDSSVYTHDVFISYSANDRAWVQSTLLPRLEVTGLRTLIDSRDFSLGRTIVSNIEEAIDNSRDTLLVISQAWLDGKWTALEHLLLATRDPAGQQQRMIALVIEPCKLPRRLEIFVYADLTSADESARELELSRVIRTLESRSRAPVAETSPNRPSRS